MRRSPLAAFAVDFFAPELQAWRGEQALWKMFWLYGVAVNGALIAVYVLAFYLDHVALRQVLLLCFAPYSAWLLISVWRCANNTTLPYWGMLARFLTVAWACNTVMMVVFLQINIITHFYLHRL